MLDEADDLYGLPLDEFTAARDALAKRLRGEKRRDEAALVKGLKRPSVAAGAINLAVRRHGADELLAAGEALREAHGALLEGSGDAAAVRAAQERERAAVRELTRLAVGDDASAATEEKVRATLHAAAVDDDVREQLEAGRLEREAEAGVDAMALMASRAAPRKPAPKPAEKRKASGKSDAERRREEAAARAQEAAETAVTAAREAEERAESAREALADAEEAARKARAVVEDLEAQERQARREAKEAEADAERRKTEARKAVKAAEARS